ncbi:aminotransferase class V-fold PLP-dependent enzyme [Nitratireductor sp. XY-223]|uniref:aminotransferase class V-fold PLP-dependent enzyme n=1 Tax=Nitratireductor sp. XY-223 TaxID=2561926 RepID=UPI0010A9CB9E|nr:aminotransferase class V-fold PLP-dependent enzyme [Nitratireductor sp. XY-223]
MSDQNDGYFLYHSIGQYPEKAADLAAAMAELAAVWGRADDQQWDYLFAQRAAYLDLWSDLIGAGQGTMTTCENVTQGLHMLMTALPENRLRGRRVLIAEDCFPSNHFLLTGLQDRLGFTLDTVEKRQGASWVADEDMIDRWDRDVALALVTWVSSTSSRKADVDALTAHAREMGSLVGVDITQAAGLLPYSVEAPVVDFAVSTSLKWMCGTPGAGILYVHPGLIAKCRPELRGWFSQDDPFSWALDRFELAPDIRRFDNGTPAMVSAAATVPALSWHARTDRDAMLAHNRALSVRLIAAADDLGLHLVTPRAEAERGGSVMLKLASEKAVEETLSTLRDEHIYADSRGPILRLSPGVMTSAEATERLIAVLGGGR